MDARANFVAIDPGIDGCGLSAWNEGQLIRAVYVANGCTGSKENVGKRASMMGLAVRAELDDGDDVLVECPRAYSAAHQKGDQNDLIKLALVVGAILRCRPFAFSPTTVFPQEWKGTVDPDIMIERIKGRLTAEETRRVVLPVAFLAHNVWDAVGIGLWRYGRLDKKRVVAR